MHPVVTHSCIGFASEAACLPGESDSLGSDPYREKGVYRASGASDSREVFRIGELCPVFI